MSHRRRERTPQQAEALFDRYIVRTGTTLPNIHDLFIHPGSDNRVGEVEEQLVLYDKKVSESDILVLRDYIHTSHKLLTKLHLNSNHIGVGGAQILAGLLEEEGSQIQELFINKNFLYDDGVVAIAEAVCKNTQLRQLKIGSNHARDEGASAVAKMMIENSTLSGLEFDGNRYTLKGLGELADALNKNKGLKVIQVGEAHNIKSRLNFVRMMIQTEDPENPRTSAVLCFSKDKDNDIIDLLLQEWRVCKREGKELIQLTREKIERFRRFNRYGEQQMIDLYEDVKEFLKTARESGVRDLNLAKILMMGRARAGKTSLVRSLVAGRSLLTGDGVERSTSSVDIVKWAVNRAKCTIWDFGGQEEYYMTHSFFVTPRCVVVICVDLSEYEDTDDCFAFNVQYFIDSMQSYAPGAKFVIVGTHIDLIERRRARELENSLRQRFEENEQANYEQILSEIAELESNEGEMLSKSKKMRRKRNKRRQEMATDEVRPEKLGEKSAEDIEVDEEVEEEEEQVKMRRNISRNSLQISTKEELFGTPGMKVAESIDVNVDEEKPRATLHTGQMKLKMMGNVSQSMETVGLVRDAKEQLKAEKLQKLTKRRDNRPTLINVCLVSSASSFKGIGDFKKTLEESIIDRSEELELSVQLPSPYAMLYEAMTGDEIILTNPHIKDYNISHQNSFAPDPRSGNGFLKSFGKQIGRASKTDGSLGRFKHGPKIRSSKTAGLANMLGTSRNAANEEITPIIEMSALYEEFVTGTFTREMSKAGRKTMTMKRKKKTKRLFSKPSELHQALSSLHEIGYILWYKDNETLRDIVFVDPQWVVQMIRTVIRHNMFTDEEGSLESVDKPDGMSDIDFSQAKDEFREKAVLDSRILFGFDVWKDASELDKFHMISLMQSFDLLCEVPRVTTADHFPKYFIPVYLKSVFKQEDPENLENIRSLEARVINNVAFVHKFTRSLFSLKPKVPGRLGLDSLNNNNNSSFFETKVIRPKNIQWRYEFNNFFPEGLFLRLLVRCQPFVNFYENYAPTETFMVGRAAMGVSVFLQVEKEKYGLKGALILTAIQESTIQSESFSYNMSDIWQVFSLFAFEIEDMLNLFPGLDTNVLVSVIHEDVGKISIPRQNLEVQELVYNSNPRKQYKNVAVKLGPESVPLHFLVPPLYILPKISRVRIHQKEVEFTQPELVRLSKIARIEYGVMAVEAQMGEDTKSKKARIHILHRTVVGYVDRLLRLLCAEISTGEKSRIRNFDESLFFLKEHGVKGMAELEQHIHQMRELEQSAFLFANNNVTLGHLKQAVRVCWKLFSILEKQLVLVKPEEPVKRSKRRR